jgi:hypothetical protein
MQPDPHARTQAAFHAALWTQDVPTGLSAPDPSEVALRFRVYRNNVQHSLIRALAAQFPVVQQLVGPDFFAAMARVFIAGNPPRDPVLLHWGAGFAGFLGQFPPVAHLPYLADVARLEFARGQATQAADAAPVPAEALHGADPQELTLVLHPSVTLFSSPLPAAQIWISHHLGAARQPLAPGPDHALIARRPDFAVTVDLVDAETHAVLGALHGGATLGQAARIADPTAALTLLLRHGLITDTGPDA